MGRFIILLLTISLGLAISRPAQAQATPDSATIAHALAEVAKLQNTNLDSAVLLAYQALDWARAVPDTVQIMQAQMVLGNVHLYRAALDESFFAYQQLYILSLSAGDSVKAATALHNMGKVRESQHATDQAQKYYLQALDILPPHQRHKSSGTIYNSLGNIHYYRTQPDSAEYYYRQSMAVRRENKDTLGLGYVKHDWALVKMYSEEIDTALIMLQEAEEIFAQQNMVFAQIQAMVSVGTAYQLKGNRSEAIKWTQAALEKSDNLGVHSTTLFAARSLGYMYQEEGNLSKALDMYQKVFGLQDSLSTERLATEVARMEAEMVLREKNKENELLRQRQLVAETRIANQQLLIGGGALLLLSLVAIALGLVRGRSRQREFNRALQQKNQEIQLKNQDINDSLAYASHLQQALLPSRTQLGNHFSEHLLLYRPLNQVSGDFFWVHPLPNQCLLVATIDCTGHGTPGAMLAVLVHSGLESVVYQGQTTEPKDILKGLQQYLRNNLQERSHDGLEIGLCHLDLEQKHLKFAGAGRPLVYIQRNELYKLDGAKQGLYGHSLPQDEYPQHEVDGFDHFDTFFLYSDGFQDQFGGPDGRKYYPKRLRQWLFNHYSQPLETVETQLTEEFDTWKGALDQVDDVLILGFRPWGHK